MSVESHSEHGEQQFQKEAVATLPQRLPTEEPLKVPHPIPYQGSKRNLAPAILGYFPERVGMLIEPLAELSMRSSRPAGQATPATTA